MMDNSKSLNNINDDNEKIDQDIINNKKRSNEIISKTPVIKNQLKEIENKIVDDDDKKTPMKKNIKLDNDNNQIRSIIAKYNSETKSLTKSKTMTENYYKKMESKAKRDLNLNFKYATNSKYDSKMETGIPFIKSKPKTKIIPFKFATDERLSKKK